MDLLRLYRERRRDAVATAVYAARSRKRGREIGRKKCLRWLDSHRNSLSPFLFNFIPTIKLKFTRIENYIIIRRSSGVVCRRGGRREIAFELKPLPLSSQSGAGMCGATRAAWEREARLNIHKFSEW
jgi:hypothetical protein